VYGPSMSNDNSYEIPFGDRFRWARTFTNPIVRQRLLWWAHDGGPLDVVTIGPLLEELERLTELERRMPRQPRYPSARWSDRNAAAEHVAPYVPHLAARLREWVSDNYPTEVDEVIIGLADALATNVEQLADADEEIERHRQKLAALVADLSPAERRKRHTR